MTSKQLVKSTGKDSQKSFQDAETQTETAGVNYIPLKVLSGFQLESAFPNFFYKPHMVLILVSFCALVGYTALSYSEDYTDISFVNNSRLGLKIAFAALLCYGALYFPSSIMQRPHYAFWRLVLAASLCYCMVLIFILFQNKEDINFFFNTFFDKNLGKPLPEKSYGDNCELSNLSDAFDMFIAAHFFGWFFKMLVVRDWKFCMFLSVFFEFLELTFKHWLPNFRECWWDSVILDILVCNSLGILCGHFFIKRFQVKRYKWTRNDQTNKKSIFGNFFEFVRTTPIDQQKWHVFSSVRRFYSVLYYIALMSAVDLSNFFNKYVLWIPASHYLMAIRIFLWGFLSIVCTREYYEYISNNMFMRLGPFLFMGHAILFVEYTMLYKFSKGYFVDPFPDWIVYCWEVILAGIIAITVMLLVKRTKAKLAGQIPEEKKIE